MRHRDAPDSVQSVSEHDASRTEAWPQKQIGGHPTRLSEYAHLWRYLLVCGGGKHVWQWYSTDHMSSDTSYVVAPSSSSGARYHSVTTWVYTRNDGKYCHARHRQCTHTLPAG
jgi:hypothetical protein